jgi:hypothetical protein
MTQYTLPGVRQEYQGADFRCTPGLHVHESGGVASKAVAYSELSAAQLALQQVIAQLESSLNSSIAAGDATLQAEINNLNLLTAAQVQLLINASIAGGVRYKGTALADETNPNTATGTTNHASGDMYRITSNGNTAFGYALNAGDYVLFNGTTWDKIDSTDPTVASGDSVIVVDHVGDNQYRVKVSQAFLDRIAGIETSLANETSRATAAESALGTAIIGEVAARTAADTALNTAIGNETSRATAAETQLQAGITAETAARTVAIAAETAARTAADAALQTTLQQAITAEAATRQQQDNQINQTLDYLGKRSMFFSVAGKIAELPTSYTAIPGVTPFTGAANTVRPNDCFVVIDPANAYDAAFYYYPDTNSAPVRVDTNYWGFEDLPPGTLVYVKGAGSTGTLYQADQGTSIFPDLTGKFSPVADFDLSAIEAQLAAQQAAINTLQGQVASEAAARQAADAAINTSLTDARATIAAHTSDLLGLHTSKADISVVIGALAQIEFAKQGRRVLNNGISTIVDGITQTVFYVDGFSAGYDFQVAGLNESAAPYEKTSDPKIEYVPASSAPAAAQVATQNYQAKITFYGCNAVANGTIEAFVQRYMTLAESLTLATAAYVAAQGSNP